MPMPPGQTVIVLTERELEKDKPCTVEGCEDNRLARGLCNAHYRRARRALKKNATPGSD